MSHVHDKGIPVFAEQGEVQIDGPHGTAASLTPEAASQTAERLIECARRAEDQRKLRTEDD